jgi:hypothetical protein
MLFPPHKDVVGSFQAFVVEIIGIERLRILVEGSKFTLLEKKVARLKLEQSGRETIFNSIHLHVLTFRCNSIAHYSQTFSELGIFNIE